MVSRKKGYLITFEGIEGSGKSTLIKLLAKALKKIKKTVLITREPGGSFLAEKIRKLLLNHSMPALTELLLLEAARVDHIENTLLPGLKNHHFVLCDRFIDSTFAYQGFARGLPLEQVQKLNQIACQKLSPDLTFFLTCNPIISLNRAKNPNRFEKEKLIFHQKVQKGFLLAQQQRYRHRKTYTLNSEKNSALDLLQQALKIIESL